MSIKSCYCGNQQSYEHCCGRFHQQGMQPKTIEALMRSRYSAYVLCDAVYLMKTWLAEKRPELTKGELSNTQWLRLEVLQSQQGLKKGRVEFNAFYLENGQEHCLNEHSLFKKVKNRWYYDQAM